jgi:hypothetical protein
MIVAINADKLRIQFTVFDQTLTIMVPQCVMIVFKRLNYLLKISGIFLKGQAMNKKAIGRVIEAKVDEWLASIAKMNKDLAEELKSDIVVTGGCIVSMLLDEPVNDFDIYFKTKQTAKEVAQHYVDYFNLMQGKRKNKLGHEHRAFVLDGQDVANIGLLGEETISEITDGQYEDTNLSRLIHNCPPDRIKVVVRSDGIAELAPILELLEIGDDTSFSKIPKKDKASYYPVFLSTNAITLSDQVQVVVRFYGEPETIHSTYDYVHCMNYWTLDTGVVLKPEALESILTKELKYVGSEYPLCSIVRMRKFIQRGWWINAGQIFKMLFQISGMDLQDPDLLEDQLVGVDTVYFMEFIDELRAAQKDSEFQLDNSYVASVIDKIF